MIPINKQFIIDNTNILKIKHFNTIDSTNDYAKAASKKEFIDNYLIIADNQSKGKGRMGKSFFSPNNGLYFSLVIKPDLNLQEIQLVTLVAAIALNDTINELYKINSKIKWLNDIYVNDKKLSGILSEGVISSQNKYDFIVLGIGINLQNPSDIPKDLENIDTSIDQYTKILPDRNSILISFLNNFYKLIDSLLNEKKTIIERYKKDCLTLNRLVKIKNDDKFYTAIDVDYSGHLIVKDKQNNLLTLNSGEVSIEI